MKVLIQRVRSARVRVEGRSVANIDEGILAFIGVEKADTEEEAIWLAKKMCSLRIFPEGDQPLNRSVLEIDGEVLVISQFTLAADIKKGNRPSLSKAEEPEKANRLVNFFAQEVENKVGRVEQGQFGANMQVELVNDGPVTLMLSRPSS